MSNLGMNSLLEVKLERRFFGLKVVRGGPEVEEKIGLGGIPETEGASGVVKFACNRYCAKNLETLPIRMGESVPEERRNRSGVISLRSS